MEETEFSLKEAQVDGKLVEFYLFVAWTLGGKLILLW